MKSPRQIANELSNVESSIATLRSDLVIYDPFGDKKFTQDGATVTINRLGLIESLVNEIKGDVAEAKRARAK